MGKAAKKKKRGSNRFDPLSRPSAQEMQTDEPAAAKPLSAHQQRHLERKRLQAETLALKAQRGKVSKASKLTCKKERRELTSKLKAAKQQLRLVKAGSLPPPAATQSEDDLVAAPPAAFQGFSLPQPEGSTTAGSWFVPPQPSIG